jgi:hypothetical protein
MPFDAPAGRQRCKASTDPRSKLHPNFFEGRTLYGKRRSIDNLRTKRRVAIFPYIAILLMNGIKSQTRQNSFISSGNPIDTRT